MSFANRISLVLWRATFRLVLFTACAALACSGVSRATAATPFSLDEAIAKTAAVHPQLRMFAARSAILDAERSEAALSPPLRIEMDIENVLGATPYTNLKSGEFTLSLAGVLERGGKREARVALAARRMDVLGIERSIVELDVLAEVARRYLDWLEAAHAQPLIELASTRQRALIDSLQKGFKMGASPQALILAAEAELQRLESDRLRASAQLGATWRSLAMMWGESQSAAMPLAPPLPQSTPELQPLDRLLSRLRSTPDIEYFASLERIRDAEYQLLESRKRRDIDWQLGVRRLNAESTNAWVAGFSVPLTSSARLGLATRVEKQRKSLVSAEREAALMALDTLLLRAHVQAEQDLAWMGVLETRVLPRLRSAAEQGLRALASGAIRYADQVQMQREVQTAERELLALRLQIYRHLVEIQRLVAEPMILRSTQLEDLP